MNLMNGQQIGYNNKFKLYLEGYLYPLLGCLFVFFIIASIILVYAFSQDFKSDLYTQHPVFTWVIIIIGFFSCVFSLEKLDKIKNLKIFYFENYILNNDDEKILYNLFIHATMSNRLCKLVSNNKKMNVVFLVEKNINEKELLQLLNEKITEAHEEEERKALEDQELTSAIEEARRYLSDNS